MARHEKVVRLTALFYELQTRRGGMTTKEIADFMGCSPRRGQSLVAELRLQERHFWLRPAGSNSKGVDCWRLEDANLPEIEFEPDELAYLQKLVENADLPRSNDAGWGQELIARLRQLHPRGRSASFENDLDPLLTATGFASRPGPHEPVDPDIYRTLSEAIRSGQILDMDYDKNGKTTTYRVWPLGILYGERNYLICRPDYAKPADEPWTFRLPDIKEVRITNQWFDVEEVDFNLSEYMSKSFGVFQNGQNWDVVWTFDEVVSREVTGYQFHHSQVIEQLDDGRTRVSFQACSLVEMCHELFKWGKHVTIEGPDELREMYDAMRLHNWSRWEENRWEDNPGGSQNL